jgi:hypothetical protein
MKMRTSDDESDGQKENHNGEEINCMKHGVAKVRMTNRALHVVRGLIETMLKNKNKSKGRRGGLAEK